MLEVRRTKAVEVIWQPQDPRFPNSSIRCRTSGWAGVARKAQVHDVWLEGCRSFLTGGSTRLVPSPWHATEAALGARAAE